MNGSTNLLSTVYYCSILRAKVILFFHPSFAKKFWRQIILISEIFWELLYLIFPKIVSVSFLSSAQHVTRFGDIWPFGKFLYFFANLNSIFYIWPNFEHTLGNLLWYTELIFIVVTGQRLKNNLAIWSHCLPAPNPRKIFGKIYSKRRNVRRRQMPRYSKANFSNPI